MSHSPIVILSVYAVSTLVGLAGGWLILRRKAKRARKEAEAAQKGENG